MNNREALAILSELGVEVVAKNVPPRPGQTRAAATLQRIVRRHGVDHARLTMQIMVESDNNKGFMTEAVIGAVSDIVLSLQRGYPDLMENDLSKVFAFFDAVPLGAIEYKYVRWLNGVCNKRHALVGLIAERIVRQFGDPQYDLLDDRKMSA